MKNTMKYDLVCTIQILHPYRDHSPNLASRAHVICDRFSFISVFSDDLSSLLLSPLSSPSTTSRFLCSILIFGPLNHFLALTAYHKSANPIDPPYIKHVQFMFNRVRFAPLTAGKQSAGVIRAHQATVTAPNGFDARPRFQGPGLNLRDFPSKKSFRATGNVKAVYWPIAPRLNTAPTATGDANMRRLSRTATVITPQVAQTGVYVRGLTRLQYREPGIAPSREYAKTTRVAVIVHP